MDKSGSALPTEEHSWRESIVVYAHPRVLAMAALGFSAGLPFLLVFSTLSAWLAEVGTSKSAIGFFSWVGVMYSVKVFWAPVIDRLPIPLLTAVLGRRRSWMLLGQLGLFVGLVAMACSDPGQNLLQVALLALWVAFASATQDVVIDAYRIEALSQEYQGAMSASYVFGYRFALLVGGAGALGLAEVADWKTAYLVMAALVSVGVMTTLLVREPGSGEPAVADLTKPRSIGQWFADAVVSPFVEFFSRNGVQMACLILALIGLFRVSDITMGVMANPFYLDMGYSKGEIASIGKAFGFFMTIAGSAIGGVLVMRFGVMRILLCGAIMVAVTNLLFAWMATVTKSVAVLAVVISADNLSGGLAIAAFIAYLSGLTNSAYTATQYALFSSLMTLPAKLLGGFSGQIVDAYGYFPFFVYASVIGIPAILLILFLMRQPQSSGHEKTLSPG